MPVSVNSDSGIFICKQKKVQQVRWLAQTHSLKKPKDYGINTNPQHKAIIYSVSFWLFSHAT
jgi:hypothetical protein